MWLVVSHLGPQDWRQWFSRLWCQPRWVGLAQRLPEGKAGHRGFWDCGGPGLWVQGVLGLWGTRALGAGDSGIVGDQSSGCRGFWNCGGSGKPPFAFQSLQGCPDARDLCLNVLPSRSLSRCLWVTLSLAACLFSL